MDWPVFKKDSFEDFNFGACHKETQWRDHSKLSNNFKYENVYSALVGKRSIKGLFSGDPSFDEIIEKNGDVVYVALWSESESWALVIDGEEAVLVEANLVASIHKQPDHAKTALDDLFRGAGERKAVDKLVDHQISGSSPYYYAYHKADEFGPFKGDYFFSGKSRKVDSKLVVISRQSGEYFLEGIYSVEEVIKDEPNEYNKKFCFRLLSVDCPDRPLEISGLFDDDFIKENIATRLALKPVRDHDKEKIHEFLHESNGVPRTDQAYLDLVNLNGELDRKVQANARREQKYLRNYLFFGKKYSQCIICNDDFPVELLVAAHIRRRATCIDAMKLDFKNNVFAICKLGCDELFERGYIAVNKDGYWEKLWKKPVVGRVAELIQSIEGKECLEFKEDSKKYFEWHYEDHSS